MPKLVDPSLCESIDPNFEKRIMKLSYPKLVDPSLCESIDSEYEKHIAELFKSYLKPLKDLKIEHATNDPKNKINISLNAKNSLGKEEYKLNISDLGFITIEASHEPGLFYGFQSFRQLCDPNLEKGLKPKTSFISSCEIKDAPVFIYRGMHLDVSRHFFNVDLQATVLSKVHVFYPLSMLLFGLKVDIFLFQFSIHYHRLGASEKHSFCVRQSYQYKF